MSPDLHLSSATLPYFPYILNFGNYWHGFQNIDSNKISWILNVSKMGVSCFGSWSGWFLLGEGLHSGFSHFHGRWVTIKYSFDSHCEVHPSVFYKVLHFRPRLISSYRLCLCLFYTICFFCQLCFLQIFPKTYFNVPFTAEDDVQTISPQFSFQRKGHFFEFQT